MKLKVFGLPALRTFAAQLRTEEVTQLGSFLCSDTHVTDYFTAAF